MVSFNTLDGQPPIIVSHRGASAVRPEHTIEAYRKAIELGSAFIEPDLVTTKDGILVARHEHTLAGTTDIAEHPEFADREWVIENFTLAELKTLRAIERTGDQRPESASYNGQFEIATLDEIIALVQQTEAETGRKIAIVPELKSPSLLLAKGYDTAQMLVDALVAHGFTDPKRVFIQSFEDGNLKALHNTIMPAAGVDFPLVQLGNTATPEGLAAIAEYADIVGPSLSAILPRVRLATPVDGDGNGTAEIRSQLTGEVTALIASAHALGLKVIPYTVRAEEAYLSLNPDGTVQTAAQEMQKLIEAGVDGFFTDHTEIGVKAVSDFRLGDATNGDDDLTGTAGIDFIHAGAGDDQIDGAAGHDMLYGGRGHDTIEGGEGDDRLYGQDGDDILLGGAGTDHLIGGLGHDLLDGGAGVDRMTGGVGDDTYRVNIAGDRVVELADEGIDTVEADISYTLRDNLENLVLTEAAGYSRGAGNALDNVITGNSATNRILGGAGDDVITGGGGDDWLYGEAGADRFVFGARSGHDRIGDFTAGEDRIELVGYSFDSMSAQQLNGRLVINLDAGNSITLVGVELGQLSESDFIFN